MDVANEILDAIEIIVDKKIRENTVQIYPGVCKSVSGNTCVMSINGRDNTVQFYGSTPTVGTIYRVFVPNGNMSMAFIIAINDDSSSAKSASIFVTGLSETDTVTATNGSKTKVGVWTQKLNPASVVPDGYTQLEYIQSTGTQCINTGITESTVYGIRMKFSVPSINESWQSLISGTLDTGFTVGSTEKATGLYVRLHGDEVLNNDTALSSSVNELVINGGKISINGSQVATYTAGALSSDSGQLYVFNNNAKSRYSNMFLYELELYDNSGATVRDYVPAKRNSDSAIGVYDLVSETFFTNSGTGTFTAGPEIPQTIDGFLIDKIKDYGTWTVTATDGTNTATQDVLVDSANVFNVEIKFVDANTVLLLHAEDFTDSSLNNLTVTNTNVTLSDNSKFGSKSFYFNGSNARLNIAPTSKFEFGTGDFTVEMWIWPESQTNDRFFFSGSVSGAFFFGIGFSGSKIGYGRASVAWDGTYAVSIPNSSWTHIALVRASNIVTIYVNGVSVGSATYTNTVTMSSGEVDIGSQGAGLYYKGCMDEVRVSNIARWTSNFTPPSEPY